VERWERRVSGETLRGEASSSVSRKGNMASILSRRGRDQSERVRPCTGVGHFMQEGGRGREICS
jgi:hypothetical protein